MAHGCRIWLKSIPTPPRQHPCHHRSSPQSHRQRDSHPATLSRDTGVFSQDSGGRSTSQDRLTARMSQTQTWLPADVLKPADSAKGPGRSSRTEEAPLVDTEETVLEKGH